MVIETHTKTPTAGMRRSATHHTGLPMILSQIIQLYIGTSAAQPGCPAFSNNFQWPIFRPAKINIMSVIQKIAPNSMLRRINILSHKGNQFNLAVCPIFLINKLFVDQFWSFLQKGSTFFLRGRIQTLNSNDSWIFVTFP